jgi:hypothetical protein
MDSPSVGSIDLLPFPFSDQLCAALKVVHRQRWNLSFDRWATWYGEDIRNSAKGGRLVCVDESKGF